MQFLLVIYLLLLCFVFYNIPWKKDKKSWIVLPLLLSTEILPFKVFQGSNFPLLSVQSSCRSTATMTIAFKSQFSFIEGGHVFASNLKNKAKQNKKKTEKRNYKTI